MSTLPDITCRPMIDGRFSKLASFVGEAAYLLRRQSPKHTAYTQGVEDAINWLNGGMPAGRMLRLVEAAQEEMAAYE
jgi:hypothetical protein